MIRRAVSRSVTRGSSGSGVLADKAVAGFTVNRERIVEMVDDRRFGYENPNPPFRTYRGLVELTTASQGGTDITWSATFEPKLRWTGPFWTWFLTRFMRRMARGLAEYAGRQGS